MAPGGTCTLPRLPQPSAEESPSHVPGLRLPPCSYRRCYGYESLLRIKSLRQLAACLWDSANSFDGCFPSAHTMGGG